ncbi:MAG: tyrosine-protein phosphatase [Chloroflexota bacterium]|jgi:protein-tyrosine phosphatase
MLGITSVPNLRDVGGKPTRDGRFVRTGLLYRSGTLRRLDDGDMEAFGQLRIRRVYDLRGARERESMPDRLPPGTEYVSADVLADWTEGGPDRVFAMLEDPETAREELGGGRVEALWVDQYRQFVTLPSAHAAYGWLFRDLARAEHRPALVHCSGGKDRTGWAAAALLLLLHVAQDVVMADYQQSDRRENASAATMMRALVERGADLELWRPVFAADPRYLEAALDQVRLSFGSIEAYFADGLGVDGATQEALRAAFVR